MQTTTEQPEQKRSTVLGLNFNGEIEQFPQVWVNKISSELFVVTPWFQVMSGDELDAGILDKTRYAIGALSQVGWLIENGNGVFFGMGLAAEQNFEPAGDF